MTLHVPFKTILEIQLIVLQTMLTTLQEPYQMMLDVRHVLFQMMHAVQRVQYQMIHVVQRLTKTTVTINVTKRLNVSPSLH